MPALTRRGGLRLLPWGLLSKPPALHVCLKSSLKAEDGLEAGTSRDCGDIAVSRVKEGLDFWGAGSRVRSPSRAEVPFLPRASGAGGFTLFGRAWMSSVCHEDALRNAG